MATFPLGVYDPTNPTPSSSRSNPSLAGEISGLNDEVVALETYLLEQATFSVKAWGAVGDDVNDDTPAILLAIIAAIANGGGIVYFPAGDYRTTSTITCTSALVSFLGAGSAVVTIKSSSTGDTLRVYSPTFNHTSAFSQTFFAGKIGGITIDGTNAGSVSSGLHYGDLMGGRFEDLVIQNFTGASATGLWMDNVIGWCEGMTWSGVQVFNCTTCIKFDVNSGAGSGSGFASFAYSDYGAIKLCPLANQDGIVINNGCLVVPLRMDVTGNFGQSISGGNTGAMLRITGSSTSAGGLSYSSLTGNFSFLGETDWDGGAGATPHQTINVDSNFNNRFEVTGFLYFINGWTATNCLGGGGTGTFLFHGFCFGDSHISDTGSFAILTTVGGTAKALGVYPIGVGELVLATGDVFDFGALFQNATITFSSSAPTMPREITIYATQAASGGPYTITWPVAPLIKWTSGSAPTMTATAGHTDVYKLYTSGNGAWIGQAIQNAH